MAYLKEQHELKQYKLLTNQSNYRLSEKGEGYTNREGYNGNPAKYERGVRQDSYELMEPEGFFETNPEAAEAYRNADTEWKNYRKGNYEYTQGKGWHLKDNK